MKSIDSNYSGFGSVVQLRDFTGKRINNTRRVKRILNLIKFMVINRSIIDISNHLNIHPKSVFRYLNLITQLGFEVEVQHRKYYYYKIINMKQYFNLE